MKSMKYTLIIWVLMFMVFLWQLVSAVTQRGLPPYPLYYVSSILEIVLGLLTIRFGSRLAKKSPIVLVLIIALCFGAPIVFHYSRIGILWQTGGSEWWYMLSLAVFNFVRLVRKTPAVRDTPLAKGFVLYLLVMIAIFLPIFILVLLLSRC